MGKKRKMMKVGAQPNINSQEYQSMFIPLFDSKTQSIIVNNLNEINQNIDLAKYKIQQSKQLQKSLINEIFSS